MMPRGVAKQDLLYHPAHGLCRVDRITEREQSGKKVPCYSLVPKVTSKMKVRFVIAAPDLESSGFHRVVSAKEASRILDYLKDGTGNAGRTDQAWVLAQNILGFSTEKLKTRDQRKRQLLEHSVKGLVGELACAFNSTLREASSRVEKSLARFSKADPKVLAALERAAEG